MLCGRLNDEEHPFTALHATSLHRCIRGLHLNRRVREGEVR